MKVAQELIIKVYEPTRVHKLSYSFNQNIKYSTLHNLVHTQTHMTHPIHYIIYNFRCSFIEIDAEEIYEQNDVFGNHVSVLVQEIYQF